MIPHSHLEEQKAEIENIVRKVLECSFNIYPFLDTASITRPYSMVSLPGSPGIAWPIFTKTCWSGRNSWHGGMPSEMLGGWVGEDHKCWESTLPPNACRYSLQISQQKDPSIISFPQQLVPSPFLALPNEALSIRDFMSQLRSSGPFILNNITEKIVVIT